MKKAEIRKLFTEKRNALSADEYAALNAQLLAQFKKLDLTGVNYIHIFLPMVTRKEPDTLPIIDWLMQDHPEITIIHPKCDFKSCSMESYVRDGALVLAQNSYGINEPVKGSVLAPEKIDMILLPLLAFDKRGYRVGYGKGFYDRFITRCRTDVQLLGLSFFEPVDEISDLDKFDKKMQGCLTATRILRFNK